MTINNQDIKRAATQLFASTRAYATPFYNREKSKEEIKSLFANLDPLRGGAVFISAPLGSGKTFLIDQVAPDLGITGRARTLLLGETRTAELKKTRGEVLFVDEADIKTNWSDLRQGMATVGEYLEKTQKVGLILGDFTLRNPDLHKLVAKPPRFLYSFEGLSQAFLRGVLRQRIQHYLDRREPEEILAPDLYEVLVPDSIARINSFRVVLTFLEKLVRDLPANRQPCQLTLAMAKDFVEKAFQPPIATDRQEDFLNLFMDRLASEHPGGRNLEQGFTQTELFLMGRQVGYTTLEDFQDEIIEPFGTQGLLLAAGVPGLDETGRFARWIEPYYPSLELRLAA